MSQEILVNVTPREVRVALLEDGVVQEVHIERHQHQGLLGNIYKGRVGRLLPGIQAAFVDIGLQRSAFLHISDVSGYEERAAKAENVANLDIRDFLQVGQQLLVQVYKEPIGTKGARLTTQFTIPSRYLVLTPNVHQIAISQKVVDPAERDRLLSLITPGPQGGYIFRTAAEGVVANELETDKTFLNALWAEIDARAKQAKMGELVYEEIPMVLRVVRDIAGYEVKRIRVDDMNAVTQMRDFAQRYVPALTQSIEFYEGDRPIFDLYAVEDELQKALQRKVHLKSGGHLVFDQTEAMTTIDVNTGSFVGSGSLEQTIFRTNLEAVEVIARQIRLRNLGGIIIIDFIDMTDPSHQTHLLQSLAAALVKDTAKTEISELSSLGLVQMTRKRTRESLEHILCRPCPLCKKRGSIKSVPTVCYDIFREIKRVAQCYPWLGFLVLASQDVVDFLLDEESTMLADLEVQLSKPIQLRTESSYSQEQFDILPLSVEKE
jgi:ribonuclease G